MTDLRYFRLTVDIAVRPDEDNPNVTALIRQLEDNGEGDQPTERLLQDRINAGFVDIDGVSDIEDHS